MLIDFFIYGGAFLLAFLLKRSASRFLWLIPSSLIAGLISFLGSSEVFKLYSLSDNYSLYIEILLSLTFACFPLSITRINRNFFSKVKRLWQYSALQYLTQWGLSLALCIFVLKHIFDFLDDSFGVVLPVGFAGGHGSAAVVGDLLFRLGHDEALTLTMTMATAGAIFAITGGIFWIHWGRKKGYLEKTSDKDKKETFDFKLDVKTTFLLFIIVTCSYFLKPFFINIFKFEIPFFAIATVLSGLVRVIKPNISISKTTLERVTNLSTDILVCVGIASIKLKILEMYIAPLAIMMIVGLCVCILYFKKIGMRVFDEDSYSKAVFTWGWSVGGLVFGLALVKMIKREKNMEMLEQFAFTYLMLAPIEITLLLTMPYLVHNGYALYMAIPLILLSLLLIKLLAKATDK